MDPYEVLGVTPNAPEDEVRRAYKRLAQRHHPDKGGDPEAMARVNDAYEAITQPDKNTGPSVEDIARQKVLQLFIKAANDNSWGQANYIQALRNGLNQAKTQFLRRQQELNTIRERMSMMIPEHPDEEENMFAHAVRGEQSKIDQDLKNIDKELEVIEKSVSLLRPYDDNLPPQQFVNSFFYTNSSTSTGGS